MFKSLGDKMGSRQTVLKNQSVAQQKATAIIAQYDSRATVAYDPSRQVLTIQAHSKTAASELLLQSTELGALLRQEKITIKRMIIR